MTTMTTVDSATLASQNIGAGLVEVFSKTLAGDDPISAIAAIRISGRGAATTVDIRLKVLVGGILLADNVVEYLATATTSLEIQTLPFIWRNGEALQIYLSSSSTADSSVGVATVVSTEDAPVIDNAAIATAVVQRTDLDQLADGSFGKLVFNTLNRLPTELEDGRVKATLSEEQIDDIMTAIGSIDQTQYENISGTSGFFFRKLQAGTTPGIPKAF